MTLTELLGLLKQYGRDAMPGGALNPEVSGQGLLDSAAMATMPVPILGDVAGLAADANRYANEPEERTPGNFAMSALGLLPFVPAMSTRKAVPEMLKKTAGKAKQDFPFEPMPEMAERYPQRVHPVSGFDKVKKKHYPEKSLGEEALAVKARRDAAQAEIESGTNYTPFFNPGKRYYADPKEFPLPGTTQDPRPMKTKTRTKASIKAEDSARARVDTPEVRARMEAAMREGGKEEGALDWYATGQWADFVKGVLGPEKGRQAYKQNFADGMAATTGGSDPTANWISAGLLNFMRHNGEQLPKSWDGKVEAFDLPYPVGGRYVGGNMDFAEKTVNAGKDLDRFNEPKRYNFSGNFLGHTRGKTIDEQMMGLVDPSLKQKAPTNIEYPIIEKMVQDIEDANPGFGNTQDAMWFGQKKWKDAKDGKVEKAIPMIDHINHSIWRGHRVTGLPQEEVAKRYAQGSMPVYSMLGAGVSVPMLLRFLQQEEEQ